MFSSRRPTHPPLRLERLEVRAVPAALSVAESFDQTLPGVEPAGWVQWSSAGSTPFAVSPARAYAGQAGLAITGASLVTARAWYDQAVPADAGVRVTILADSLEPVEVIARGSGLGGTTPTYYAVTLARGLDLQLTRVVNGQTTVLASLRSASYVSGRWLRVTLQPQGSLLQAEVFDPAAGRFLNAAGQWQAPQTYALTATDTAIGGDGRAGLGRPAQYAGTNAVDDFSVLGAGVNESFDTTPAGALPAGWTQWANDRTNSFAVSAGRSLSGGQGLTTSVSNPRDVLTWYGQPLPADAQVSAAVYLDSTIPVRLFLRGADLYTGTPDYYAVTITRGLTAELTRVLDGQATPLGRVSSAAAASNLWVRVTLAAVGDTLSLSVFRPDTAQYLGADGQWVATPATALTAKDGAITGDGFVGFVRTARPSGSVTFDDFQAAAVSAAPAIPSHYSHIRIAMLAWSGTPFTDFENNLLRTSVDLVLPNEKYLGQINTIAPNTPQLIYTNVSNLYLNLLTDWLNYADAHGLNRESAFYHVTQATPYTGGSPSSIPVNWLWSVRRDNQDLTSASRDSRVGDVAFGAAGQSLYMGYTDRFRELNFNLSAAAANGWTGVFEYATAVDAQGNPTAWKTLTLLDDATNGFRQSGAVHFDPPADWVPNRFAGGPALYYVRVRTLTAGTAPVATTILGRDYVNATALSNGGTAGTIPAFDTAADLNHDGYLSDAEYARRAPGKDARFLYESRLFYQYYGQMRFAANPIGAGYAAWVTDFETRFLAANPLADGLFVDNSEGKSPTAGVAVAEPSANYTADYAALLGTLRKAVAPHWLMANTAGLYALSDAVIRQVQGNYQEFAIRPLSNTWSLFEDVAAMIKHRQGLTSPAPYTVIDSLPTSATPGVGSPTDPTGRTQIATLAYYYLIGNPQTTFLLFNGGNEPASSWTRHWIPAVQYDVGQPQGDWSVFATGADPANAALTYKVYQRSYANALVLYKPVSYKLGAGTGTVADNTATTHQLNGTYRPLNADGTLGAPVTSVTLRNGEGAILVKVG
jgi:hypothetical protein